jgi:acyl-CoA thioester hydrolase
MSALTDFGFDHQLMVERQIGPVVFYEHIYYFKEVLPGPPVRVSFEVKGLSKDGMFFEFQHNFYDHKGRNIAHCELMGGWIDLKTRKLIALEPELLNKFDMAERSDDFRILSREDTRKFARKPIDLVSSAD